MGNKKRAMPKVSGLKTRPVESIPKRRANGRNFSAGMDSFASRSTNNLYLKSQMFPILSPSLTLFIYITPFLV